MKIRILLSSLFLILSFSVQAQKPVWDANKVDLVSQKLADGVYAVYEKGADIKAPKGIPMATSGGIIIGDKGVMLVETMLNKRLYKQMTALVTELTDKPILYAVNTSHHGDHAFGNYYLPESTQIIQHSRGKARFETRFEEDRNLMLGIMGKGRGVEAIKPRSGDILIKPEGSVTIDLGGREVFIKDFGFAQTGDDLFVWLPEEKVLWTGNPVVAEAPALPWLLQGRLLESLETLEKVRDFIDSDTTVVPGHSRPTTSAVLDWNIDYLRHIKSAVASGLDKGWNQGKIVAATQAEQYQGYALFKWVHFGLNLPAAFRDLSPAGVNQTSGKAEQ